jgi:hypothetical protein
MSEKENDDFLSGGEGFDQLRASDLKTPYLKIAQKSSHEVDKDSPVYIPGLECGDVFNSITKEILGPKIEVVILHWAHVWLEYKMGQLGNLLGRWEPDSMPHGAPVDKSDFGKWRTVKDTQIVDTYNFFVLIKGKEEQGICVMPFSGTGVPDAQTLLQTLLMAKTASGAKASIYAYFWEFPTIRNENAKGAFWRYGEGKASSFRPNGQLTRDYFDKFQISQNVEIAKGMKVLAPPTTQLSTQRGDM